MLSAHWRLAALAACMAAALLAWSHFTQSPKAAGTGVVPVSSLAEAAGAADPKGAEVRAPAAQGQRTPGTVETGSLPTDDDTSIASRTRTGTILVVVVDHDKRARPGMLVRVAQPGRWGLPLNIREVATNRNGVARFTEYPVDRERFWLEVKRGTQRMDVREAPRSFHRYNSAGNTTMVKILCPSSATIEGRVTRPDGTPVENAAMVAHPDEDPRRAWKQAATDHLGNYHFRDLKPGPWSVTLVGPFDLAWPHPPTTSKEAAPGRVTRIDFTVNFKDSFEVEGGFRFKLDRGAPAAPGKGVDHIRSIQRPQLDQRK